MRSLLLDLSKSQRAQQFATRSAMSRRAVRRFVAGETLARQGYRVRVYVPYGTHWYPYFMRRLAERPANVLFLARHLIRA
jgi:proline dehydrogenase